MTEDIGIIDQELNPFVSDDWIEQKRKLTPYRLKQLKELIDVHVETIKSNRNEGAYPAFVGIRWGFAEVQNRRLKKTEKMDRIELYDGFGKRVG